MRSIYCGPPGRLLEGTIAFGMFWGGSPPTLRAHGAPRVYAAGDGASPPALTNSALSVEGATQPSQTRARRRRPLFRRQGRINRTLWRRSHTFTRRCGGVLHHSSLRVPRGLWPSFGRSGSRSPDDRAGHQATENPSSLGAGDEEVLSLLEAGPAGAEWPAPETAFGDQLLSAAALVFVEPARAGRARQRSATRWVANALNIRWAFWRSYGQPSYGTVLHPFLWLALSDAQKMRGRQ